MQRIDIRGGVWEKELYLSSCTPCFDGKAARNSELRGTARTRKLSHALKSYVPVALFPCRLATFRRQEGARARSEPRRTARVETYASRDAQSSIPFSKKFSFRTKRSCAGNYW